MSDAGDKPSSSTSGDLETPSLGSDESLPRLELSFRELVENLNDVIYTVDLDGTIRYVSPAIETVLGYEPEELIGTPLSHILDPADRSRIEAAFGEVLRGSLRPREYRILDRSKNTRWVRTSSRPIVRDGTVVGLQGVLTEITESKLNEEARREAERSFREALENVAMVAVSLDRDGCILFINDFALGLTGWSRKDVLGRNWFDLFIPGARREAVRRMFECGFADGSIPAHFENPIVTRSGKELEIQWSNSLLRDRDGQVTATVSFGGDVTEQTESRQALEDSEQRFRALFESMAEGFAVHEIITDDDDRPVDYRFIDANPAFFELTGLDDHIIVRTVLEVLPDIEPFWIQTYGEVALSGVVRKFEHFDQSLGRRWEVQAYSPGPGRFATLFWDVTERRKIEEERGRLLDEIRALASRLESTEEAERESLARELHDRVGQNLTSLALTIDLVRHALPAEVLGTVSHRLNSAAELVTETMSQVRNVMSGLRPPMLDGYGLIPTLGWWASIVKERVGLEVRVTGAEPEPRLGPEVEIGLFRIVQEALSNVAEHSGASGARVTVTQDSARVVLKITDRGCGFSPSEHTALGDASSLGLSIMRERGLALGAQVTVKSEPGDGTRVVVELPRKRHGDSSSPR